MLCLHCGTNLEKNYKYCPNCGTIVPPALSDISSSPLTGENADDTGLPLKTVKKRPMPLWFKLVLLIAVLALIGVTAGILFTERLVDVIDKQLEALAKEDISKAYYDYSSKNFQAAFTLDQFRQFVDENPILTHHQSAHFTERSIKDNVSSLKGKITSPDHRETPIEYQLIKEGDQWKILSMLLPSKKRKGKEVNPAAELEPMIGVVRSQLQAIKNRDYQRAYEGSASAEFRQATSEQNFESFLKRYPIFENYKTLSFHKRNDKKGQHSLSVILQTDQFAAYLKYYLVEEKGKWKILSMRILSPEEERELESEKQEPIIGPMSFAAMQLGSTLNQEGVIENPVTTFDSKLGDLYVNLDIKNGTKGQVIYFKLENLESGSSIPLRIMLENDGDTSIGSDFSPPASGWPKGKYRLSATSPNGLEKSVDFEVD